MISVRIGTFETNSSSAHCLILAEEKEFNSFMNGKSVLLMDNNKGSKILSWSDAHKEFIERTKKYIDKHPSTHWYLNTIEDSFGTTDINKISKKDFIEKVSGSEWINCIPLWPYFTFTRWASGSEEGPSTYTKNEKTDLIELSTNYFNG